MVQYFLIFGEASAGRQSRCVYVTQFSQIRLLEITIERSGQPPDQAALMIFSYASALWGVRLPTKVRTSFVARFFRNLATIAPLPRGSHLASTAQGMFAVPVVVNEFIDALNFVSNSYV